MIKVEGLHKSFGDLHVLKGIDENITKGEVVVVIGPSGSGKSTFLRCINLMEVPTKGKILVEGINITDAKTDINDIRQRVGMVFQHFNLFPNMTVLQNITLAPIKVKKMSEEDANKIAYDLLDKVGLREKANEYPNKLSGGQKQRIAIARAMANRPDIVLADEPTGALDTKTGRLVMDLFHKLNKTEDTTLILITHNPELAEETGRIVTMVDGRLK